MVADTLSRAALNENNPEIKEAEIVHYVSTIVNNIPISQKKLT